MKINRHSTYREFISVLIINLTFLKEDLFLHYLFIRKHDDCSTNKQSVYNVLLL